MRQDNKLQDRNTGRDRIFEYPFVRRAVRDEEETPVGGPSEDQSIILPKSDQPHRVHFLAVAYHSLLGLWRT
jgi:hypothetical protein